MNAIECCPDAFSLFDSDDRLVNCNTRYKDYFYAGDQDFVQPGVRFEDLVRRFVDNEGESGAGSDGAGYEERIARHRKPGTPHEYRLANEKWVRTLEYRTADGGIVWLHTDTTDKHAPPEQDKPLVLNHKHLSWPRRQTIWLRNLENAPCFLHLACFSIGQLILK